MNAFTQQLYGAFRTVGVAAAPLMSNSDITFCCPACVLPTKLDVEEGMVFCPACSWGAMGEPWEIAAEAARTRPAPAPAPRGLPLLDLYGILNYTPDPKEEIWPGGILSAGMPSALVGAPGVGKSRLSLQAAICTILGWKFLGWPTRGEGLKWLFLQTENSTARLKMDLEAMTSHLEQRFRDKIYEHLRVLDVMALDFATICMTDGHPDRVRIMETLEDWQPDIVVVDPLRDAGSGDPNKDADMTETCKGLASAIRKSNPRRTTLVVHHGRTGAAEASKVYGDDAASFGRNSKVLYGWLRSQINVAAAGIAHPDTVIVGCGKCSNGPKWEPFAARLNPNTNLYRRLEPCEFDLEEWAANMGGGGGRWGQKKRRVPEPAEVARIVETAGGELPGGKNAPDGLVARVVEEDLGVSRNVAIEAVREAVESNAITVAEKPGTAAQGGGIPGRIYRLNLDKMYEKQTH